MADTKSTAFAAAVTFTVQSKVLQNLRNELIWANPAMAETGRFDRASDQLMFLTYPDLSNTTPQTPLTEGTPPTARTISMNTVIISTAQYGDLVSLTDLAKVKAPSDVVAIASERVGRVAKEVIDVVTRDAIFLGGTPYYQAGDTTRAGLASNDYLLGSDLMALRAKMILAKIPTFPDGTYRLYIHPAVGYDLRTDATANASAWMGLNQYQGKEEIQRGEIGKMHGFRIIEVYNAPTFSSTTTVYGSLALGDIKGWGAGELQTLRAYHIAPGGDHTDPLGQLEYVGWKVNFGCAPLNNGYYYRVESAATAL